MTAKDLFEKYGFELELKSDKELVYSKSYEHNGDYINKDHIIFNLEHHQIFLDFDFSVEYMKECSYDFNFYLSRLLLYAINKQVEELKWDFSIDEDKL